MHQTYTVVNCLSIRPDRITLYSKLLDYQRGASRPKLIGSEIRERQKMLSVKARRRMGDAINTLIYMARDKRVFVKDTGKWFRFKVGFITLTLPSKQIHTDRDIHGLVFRKFMANWAKQNPGMLYVWKAEVQDNGNLHYHITTNVFIHHRKLRSRWNKAVEVLGYVSRSGSDNPNSTDVHSVKSVKSLSAYMVKYMSKGDQYSKVQKRWLRRYGERLKSVDRSECKLPDRWLGMYKRVVDIQHWGCSKVLNDGKACVIEPSGGLAKEVDELWKYRYMWNEYEYCRVLYIDRDLLNELPNMDKVLSDTIKDKHNIIQVKNESIYVESMK